MDAHAIQNEQGKVNLIFQNYEIELSETISDLIKDRGYIDRVLVLGIRPEDIEIKRISDSLEDNRGMESKVAVAEMMGSDIFLYFNIGDNDIVARINANETIKAGDGIEVFFNINKIHLFDKETESSIAVENSDLNEVQDIGEIESNVW